MTCHIYALLVGIDNYPPPVSRLKGCVNDIIVVETYLKSRLTQENFQLQLKILTNQEATRQAIINGFRQHLSQAQQTDVALFYYSGHGSQAPTPPEFWHLEPDRMDETLVCWDSRTEGSWDLVDKELAKLIAEVAQKNPHITIILDCCHSGSGTRDLIDVRQIPPDNRQRPLSSFLFSPEELPELTTSRSSAEHSTGWLFPKGRHILLAACRDREKAKEYYAEGDVRGAFSYFLLKTLKQANGNLTYRDLFKRTNALVRSKIAAQSPQIEATELADIEQPFLGGAIAQRYPYYTVSCDRRHRWVIDGGSIHGIPAKAGKETTGLVLFPFDSLPENLRQRSWSVGEADVIEVLPHVSRIQIQGIENLTPDLTFKAVITRLPLPPLGILLEGNSEGIEFLQQALNLTNSLYVQAVTAKEKATFRVLAHQRKYIIKLNSNGREASHFCTLALLKGPKNLALSLLWGMIWDTPDERPLVDPYEYNQDSASRAVQQLEHIARWMTIVELASPANSYIRPDAVRLDIYQNNQLLEARQICLKYQLDINGKGKKPSFFVKLTNTSDEPLYCALLNLTERYGVWVDFFESGGVLLNPGEEAWSKRLFAEVPEQLWEQDITESKDIFKLIVSTAEFDVTLLQQGNLDSPQKRSLTAPKILKRPSMLNRLMNRIQTREISTRSEEEFYDDWVTSQVVLSTVRPRNLYPLSGQK